MLPETLHPLAVAIEVQVRLPLPSSTNAVAAAPWEEGKVYETPPTEREVEERVVAPVTPSVDDRVVAPVTARVEERVVAPATVKVPVMDGESFKAMVAEEPKVISPPPVRLVPAVMVIFELARAELEILVMVLLDPLIVLLVKVCVLSIPTKVVVTSGRVMVLAAVGVQVRVPVGPPDWNTSWSLVAERFRVLKVGVAVVETS